MEIVKCSGKDVEFDARDRKSARFSVPGATISFDQGFLGHRRQFASERSPVLDLSKGGISFLTNRPPKSTRVSLLLSYSENEEPIRLEGRIVYFVTRGTRFSHRFRVGVAFAPFSPRKGHNSPETLNLLDKLEKTYATDNDSGFPGSTGNSQPD